MSPHPIPTWYDESRFQGTLVEMPRPECLRKLSVASFGRVAYAAPEGPVVIPVNVAVHGTDVFLRTTPGSELARALNDAPASLQVDDVDEFNRSGWSVLLQGHATWVGDEELPTYYSERPVPWARGKRSQNIRIRATHVAGRRLLPW